MFSTSENYWCGQRLNAPEAVDLPAGFVDDLVAGFQIVILQVAFQITLSPLDSPANRALSPLLETQSQRNRCPFGIPARFEMSTHKWKMVCGHSFQNAPLGRSSAMVISRGFAAIR